MPTNNVAEFFDRISGSYGEKYSAADLFHHYFFHERLIEATREISFENKRVLDVGAGTGSLFDHLKGLDPKIDYYATDISSGMLESSSIPTDRRFLGRIGDVALPVGDFDRVFMLGVTTYLDDAELSETFDAVHRLLKSSGLFIVTFTNRSSIDWRVRSVVKMLGRNFISDKAVLGQSFHVFPRSLGEVRDILTGRFEVSDTRFLNHTVFPFNRLFKKSSIALARKIHRGPAGRKRLPYLSSDFLLVLRKI